MPISINVCRGLLIITAAIILFYIIMEYFNKNDNIDSEKFMDDEFNDEEMDDELEDDEKYSVIPRNSNTIHENPTQKGNDQPEVKPSHENIDDQQYRPINFKKDKLPNDCFPKDKLTAEDLLPKNAANSRSVELLTSVPVALVIRRAGYTRTIHYRTCTPENEIK